MVEPGSHPYDDLERPPLDAAALQRSLAGSRWREVRVVDETASTNADLVAAASADEPDGVVLVAESQTEGRGRLDRGWESPPRSGLTVSMLVRPAATPARWGWLPLMSGLAVVDVLWSTAMLKATLKWPNDVLLDDRKVAGILLERVDDAAVIGIGLNVTMRADERPTTQSTSLVLEGAATTDRATLLKAVLRALETRLAAWEQAGGDAQRTGLLDDYRAACGTLGRDVEVSLPGGSVVTGRAQSIDDDGRLLLIGPDGRQLIAAGDITHLR